MVFQIFPPDKFEEFEMLKYGTIARKNLHALKMNFLKTKKFSKKFAKIAPYFSISNSSREKTDQVEKLKNCFKL